MSPGGGSPPRVECGAMTNKGALGRLLAYTTWANHRVMRAAVVLSPMDFRKDMGSSHGGVRGTLAHMLSSEWLWLERFKGVSPDKPVDESVFPDLMSLRDRWTAIEAHRDSWFDGLPEDAVSRRIHYRTLAGLELLAPLWQLIQHVANHATYHRGQVITLLRVLGVAAPTTDLVLWDRERLAAKAREAERHQEPEGGGEPASRTP
jgi:uncharacterized damage-inducible protein DinB